MREVARSRTGQGGHGSCRRPTRGADRPPRLPIHVSGTRIAAAGTRAVCTAVFAALCSVLGVAFTIQPPLSFAAESPFPEIPGWSLKHPPVTYTPDNLWDFINGAAESFIAYSFRDLKVGEYANADSVAVRAEIYRHADADHAFGIYSTERAPDYSFKKVGAQGYQQEGVLNFLTGPYYVKLSTHQCGSGAEAGLRTVAGHIDAYLGAGSDFPPGVHRLPAQGRQQNTEGFVAREFLGYGFLHHAFTARYERGTVLFVMEYPTADSAATALRKLLTVVPGTSAGPDRFRIADPNNGSIAIARDGGTLFGAVGAPNAETEIRLLGQLEKSIHVH